MHHNLSTLTELLGAPALTTPTGAVSNLAAISTLSILGASAAVGIIGAAKAFSNQRITVVNLDYEPPSTLEKIEEGIKRNKKGILKVAALGALAAILGAGFLPEAARKPFEGIQPLATGQWYVPEGVGTVGGRAAIVALP